MKKSFINKAFVGALALCAATFTSCVEDEGNYNYKELAKVSIENIPEMTEVLSYIDHIKISPKIIVDGNKLAADNKDFTVLYRFGHKGMGSFGYDEASGHTIAWKEYKPTTGFDLDIPAEFSTGAYTLWVTVTDNRDGSVTSKQYYVNVGSTTYEGWLVLCNEGADNRVRLDMISRINSSRIDAIHNICAGLPEQNNATGILFFPDGSDGDQIHLFSKDGSYCINSESMEYSADEDGTFVQNFFAFDPKEKIVKEDVHAASAYGWLEKYRIAFSENNNAYVMVAGQGGAAYSTPINTLEEGTDVQFEVAPYVGYAWIRPIQYNAPTNLLFYDSTNKRFLIFYADASFDFNDRMQLATITEPGDDEVKLFTYNNTGKDLLFMQSTRRAGGVVYSVMQDAEGNRSIYGINMSTDAPVQSFYIDKVDAPDFNNATQFAFDNLSPYLFYAVGGKVYCYNLATKQTKEVATGLADGDVVTKMVFNLYRATDYDELINQTDEFMNQQYRLVICSYNEAAGVNGGKVTICDVNPDNGNLTPGEQYDGFAKIVDIIYRERTE